MQSPNINIALTISEVITTGFLFARSYYFEAITEYVASLRFHEEGSAQGHTLLLFYSRLGNFSMIHPAEWSEYELYFNGI